jgi:S1-C subfamily serine protease
MQLKLLAKRLPGVATAFVISRSGSISRLVTNPKDGYAFVYDVGGFPGMSGGAILDEDGKLVGIHGRATTRPDTNAKSFPDLQGEWVGRHWLKLLDNT